MRKILFIFCILMALLAQAATFPVSFASLPNLGTPRIKVVGQNCENYFVMHFGHSNSSVSNVQELQAKTDKIVSAFRYMDADIYGLVELEKGDTSLIYLTAAMNAAAGSTVYAYVRSNVATCSKNDSTYGDIMAGFIYKISTVTPVGSCFALATGNTYGPRMRGQFFRENSTGETFLMAMNHFKAKSDASSQQTRVSNASAMLSAINSKLSTDPDVLVMGDLNCETSETAIQNIIAAGYTEMLEYYNSTAYSYYYSGNTLIDHALANNSLKPQVTGAGVFHVNTGSRTKNTANYNNYHYSDHDAVMVGLLLGDTTTVNPGTGGNQPTACDSLVYDMRQNLGGFTAVDKGGSTSWSSDSVYGAKLSAYYSAEDDWLISPEMDLSDASSATLNLLHQIYYDNGTVGDYVDQQTLHFTTNYTGDPATTTWQQVVIPTYPLKKYATVAISIPAALLTSGVRMAFHTVSDDPATNRGNYWEIKTASIVKTCSETPGDGTGVEETATETTSCSAVKMLIDGKIVILTPAGMYDVFGRKLN